MNTAVTQCPRCTGAAGAHFASCFIAQLWERLMGPGFPWAPKPATTFSLDEVMDIVAMATGGHATEDPLPPEPPEDDWDWMDFQPGADEPDGGDFQPGAGPTLDERWAAADPPDPGGVAEDTAVAMGAPSDADWLPDGLWMPTDERQVDSACADCGGVGSGCSCGKEHLHVEVVTHLPEGYYGPTPDDQSEAPSKPGRSYNTTGLHKARGELLKGQEDAAILFVYDRCDFTAGGRVPLSELYDRYDEWRLAGDMQSMSKKRLRELLVEVGLEVRPGRLPGMRSAGRAPLLVHGITLRPEVQEAVGPEPKVIIVPEAAGRERHPLIGAKPGRELPKQLRDLIEPLITEQRWEYQPHSGSGRGKPRVKSPEGKVCTLPSSPHSNGHTLENTRSFLKQNGALL